MGGARICGPCKVALEGSRIGTIKRALQQMHETKEIERSRRSMLRLNACNEKLSDNDDLGIYFEDEIAETRRASPCACVM